jgi:hypothetical protein
MFETDVVRFFTEVEDYIKDSLESLDINVKTTQQAMFVA